MPADTKNTQSGDAARKGAVRAVVGALLLILIGDALWARFLSRVMTDHALLFTVQEQRSRSSESDVLLVGDSALGHGVDARIISGETGLSAVDVALVGYFGIYGDYRMLRSHLDRGHLPKAIVLMHVYDVWHREIEPNIYRRCAPSPGEAATDFLLQRGRPVEALDLLLGRLSETYRYKAHLQQVLCRNWLPLIPLDQSSKEIRYRKMVKFRRRHGWSSIGNLEHENRRIREVVAETGYYPHERRHPVALAADAQYHLDFVQSAPFRISPDNRYWLERICGLAATREVPVYLAYGPLLRDCLEAEEFQPHLAGLREFFQEFQKAHPGFHVLTDDFFPVEVNEALNNIDHVTLEGERRFSRYLASRLSAALGSGAD